MRKNKKVSYLGTENLYISPENIGTIVNGLLRKTKTSLAVYSQKSFRLKEKKSAKTKHIYEEKWEEYHEII